MGSEAIFVGRVLETLPVKHAMDKDSWTPGYSMRFHVEESLKGVQGGETTIETGSGGGDCGTPLRPGDRFLIFAYKNKDGALWTGMCSGNQQLSGDATDETIIGTFRELSKLTTISIFGHVFSSKPFWHDDDIRETQGKPMQSTLVRAVSEGGERTTKTDGEGSYQFVDLPKQKYKIFLEKISGIDYSHEYEENYDADLSGGECKSIDFRMEPSTRIRGHVSFPAGFAQQTVEVEAIPTSLRNINQFSGKWDFTDDTGSFDLWPLPPGDYLVGVNINSSPKADSPFPPTYYPGVSKKSLAKVVHIKEGEIQEIELPLTELAEQRTVSFIATGLDGKPLKTIYIQLEDLRHPGDAASYVNVDLDTEGKGSLEVFAGYHYHLHGSHWVKYQNDWCAKPVEIPAEKGPVNIRFVMDRSSGNCDIYEIDHLKR